MRPSENGEPLTEDSPTEAKWEYPKSKLATEAVIHEAAQPGTTPTGPRTVILRIAGVYDELCHSIPIAHQISRIYEKRLESWFFPGDDQHGQAFVHLDDLADCFVKVVGRRDQLDREEVLLIAEPDVMSYEELQRRIGEKLYGTEWPSMWMPKPLAKAGAWIQNQLGSKDRAQFIKPWMIDLADDHYPVDIKRARQLLGWEPQHRLRSTLDEMIDNLQRDPWEWYKQNRLPLPSDLQRKAETL
jgi:nucleoside-diphosphate-sugar epimerase